MSAALRPGETDVFDDPVRAVSDAIEENGLQGFLLLICRGRFGAADALKIASGDPGWSLVSKLAFALAKADARTTLGWFRKGQNAQAAPDRRRKQ